MKTLAQGLRERAAALNAALLVTNGMQIEETRLAPVKSAPMDKRDRPPRKAEYQVIGADTRVELNSIEQVILEKATNKEVRALQEFNDCVLLLASILKCHPHDTDYWKNRMHKSAPLRKALDSQTATEGLEWVPTGYSADWIRFVDLDAKVKGLFREIQMPTDPYKIPYQGAQVVVQKVAEQTADAGTKIADVSPAASANVSLDTVKLGGRIPIATELTEDSIVPVLPTMREDLAKAIGRGIDYAIINGDSDGAHQDSDIGASAVHRGVLWNGLRKHMLSDASFSKNIAGAFTSANLGLIRSYMGKYGAYPEDLAWIVSPKTVSRHLQTLAEVITREKYGDQATILNGEIARVFGIPVIVSTQMREDLNTAGKYDGTTTDNTVILLVHRPSWIVGRRRELTIKVWENPEYDQIYLIATARHDFKTPWTDQPVCVGGLDVDLS